MDARLTVTFCDVEPVLAAATRLLHSTRLERLLSGSGEPLIVSSARTRAEVESVQRRLSVRHPFICESGAAAYIPAGYFGTEPPGASDAGPQVVEYGRPYEEVIAALAEAARRLRIDVVGFNDLSIEQVAMECRLSLLDARLAKMRGYSEPFRIVGGHPSHRSVLCAHLRAAGWRCSQGAQFDLLDWPVDEAVAMDALCRQYETRFGGVIRVGIGDGAHDARLLSQVDVQELVKVTRSSTGLVEKPVSADGATLFGYYSSWLQGRRRVRPGFVSRPTVSAGGQ